MIRHSVIKLDFRMKDLSLFEAGYMDMTVSKLNFFY